MACHDNVGRRSEADVRVLSRALRSVRPCHRRTGREPVTPESIPFIDLRPGEDAAAVRAAIERVITSGWFVLGPEVEAFEAEFADASGAAHAVGVGNGTDAIALLLRAVGINAGDEVIVPALTAGYTAMAVLLAG